MRDDGPATLEPVDQAALIAALTRARDDLRDLGDAAHAAAARITPSLVAAQVQHRGAATTYGPEAVTRRWTRASPRRSQR